MDAAPVQTATPVEPDANKGCRAFIRTAVFFWAAIMVWLWFALQCPPVGEHWNDCDTPSTGGWMVLALLAAPVALVFTTIVIAGIRLLIWLFAKK